MAIIYTKLFALLKEKGFSTYRIRKERLLSQGTLTNLRNDRGGLDAKTLNRLCKVLDCQPGDLMEYVPDETEECVLYVMITHRTTKVWRWKNACHLYKTI